ncbi:hypothetical protein GCM10023193_22890 [Planotetraspora kaengkrachanensis]|uniref:Uncharacterized protein n=1 Tax=Planotetraspora kaengkrachanensis TaxID=575193 RepID=A0A8J3PT80_9ACTN|nr:hypothetical protein Pka01_31250 [Planotetraspora kaengkrachanensis]
MIQDEALANLRRELDALGVPTEDRDVLCLGEGDPALSLAPALVVWVTLRHGFRWVGRAWSWESHPLDDAPGAARLIVPLRRERIRDVGQCTPTESHPETLPRACGGVT